MIYNGDAECGSLNAFMLIAMFHEAYPHKSRNWHDRGQNKKKNVLAFAQETPPPPPTFLSSQILGRRRVKSARTMTQGDTRGQTDKSARRKDLIQSKTIMILFGPSR